MSLIFVDRRKHQDLMHEWAARLVAPRESREAREAREAREREQGAWCPNDAPDPDAEAEYEAEYEASRTPEQKAEDERFEADLKARARLQRERDAALIVEARAYLASLPTSAAPTRRARAARVRRAPRALSMRRPDASSGGDAPPSDVAVEAIRAVVEVVDRRCPCWVIRGRAGDV